MPTEVWRPGDYRVCPSCGTRHKVQDLRCTKCNTVLAGTAVHHAASVTAPATRARSSRGLRALLALALLVAIAAGLWIRSLFREANLQDSVQASSAATAAVPAPQPAPSWSPPVLQYPPVVGYNRGVPPGMAALSIQPSPAPTAEAGPGGMVSIASPTEPTRKTAFTNEDLQGRHEAATPMPPPAAPAVTTVRAAATPAAAPVAAPVGGPGDEARQEWLSKMRDREDDVQKAQAKVRRLQAAVDLKRAAAAGTIGEAEARDKAQKDVMDALDDLEKAERKLADKQRDLDEEKDRARAAGIRFER